MSNSSNRLAVSSAYSAANYLPATLKTNKSGWIIEYYVENPQTQELSRKRIKLQRLLARYTSKTEARKHINNIIVALNMKLSTGWNPYFQGEDSRMYTPIQVVLEQYREEVAREHRKATAESYISFSKIFGDWIAVKSDNTPADEQHYKNTFYFCGFFSSFLSFPNGSHRSFPTTRSCIRRGSEKLRAIQHTRS